MPEEVLVDQIAKLVDDLVDGTLGAPVFNGEQLVTVVIADVEAIVDRLAGEIALVTDICKVLTDLYAGVTINGFVDATVNLLVDDVINAVAYVVGYNYTDIDLVAKLLTDLLTGTITAPVIDGEQLVTEILADIEVILSKYYVSEASEAVFAELNKLYADATINSFVDTTLAIAMDDAIAAVEAILVAAMAEQASIISAVAQLATDLVDGTIGAPEFIKTQLVTVVLADVKAILDNFVDSDVVDTVFTELAKLYDGVTLEGIVDGTLAIAMDNVIASAEEVVKAVLNSATVRDAWAASLL